LFLAQNYCYYEQKYPKNIFSNKFPFFFQQIILHNSALSLWASYVGKQEMCKILYWENVFKMCHRKDQQGNERTILEWILEK
jgi:hypothetical protein